ncbi:hypothetical protein [Ancylobacter vacuolatus]|uniref:Uncharacterized protein n=1 Tax=Ancylobacter vacuolatus TaxID=223389 RepID=A0ABU0DMU2_9HYPH|nr:hypothetical protein [Ancylobacter vacuolatus]MDQ0349756.1 hypothetical protein [Ancylobacter vacuolatus]
MSEIDQDGITTFTRRPTSADDPGGTFRRITCRCCPNAFEMRARRFMGRVPDLEGEVLPEAKKAGWDVLHGARKAVCPRCLSLQSKAKARKEAKIMVAKMPTPMPRAPQAEPAALKAVPAGKAEAPPAMDIDAAFLIRDKLGEVYLDAQRGYGEGWTDKRVAESLTVPRDWVRQVRCKVYGAGSAGGAEDFAPVLAEARAALAAAKDLTEQGLKVQQEMAVFDRARGEVLAQVGRLERRLADIEKAVG